MANRKHLFHCSSPYFISSKKSCQCAMAKNYSQLLYLELPNDLQLFMFWFGLQIYYNSSAYPVDMPPRSIKFSPSNQNKTVRKAFRNSRYIKLAETMSVFFNFIFMPETRAD